MTFPKVTLTNTLHLVVSPEKWDEAVRAYGASIPADRKQLVDELNQLATTSGIPLLVETMKDGQVRLIFCTARFELGCGLTEFGDAYRLHFIAPLSLRRYGQLARRMIFVVVKSRISWRIVKNVQTLQELDPPQSGFQEIMTAWQQAGMRNDPAGGPTGYSPDHYKFLSDLDELVDLASQVELDSHKLESVPVVDFSPVPAERYAREVYQFKVVSHSFKVGDYIWAGQDDPGVKGIGHPGAIIKVTLDSLVVSFHQQVSVSLLQGVEWLRPFVSLRQYEIQKTALKALHDGNSSNPHLLDIVVKGLFAKLGKSLPVPPAIDGFNLSQCKAISYAENIPDMLLVVGPPGTGKTKSIREMVKHSASRGEKVLVTSKNNKAVDNVLEGLKGVDALRIGREEAVSANVVPLMIDAKARELQEVILSRTKPAWESMNQAMSRMSQIDNALDQLGQNAARWQNAIDQHKLEIRKLKEWRAEVQKSFQPVMERLENVIRAKETKTIRLTSDIQSLSGRISRLSSLAGLPLVGWIFNGLLARAGNEIQDLQARQTHSIHERERVAQNRQKIINDYQSRITESEEAIGKKGAVDISLARQEECKKMSTEFLVRLDWGLSRFPHAPHMTQPASPQDVAVYIAKFRAWQGQAPVRFALLGEWRTLLQTRHQALYPTLIRMADVVGATCIGIATDARFEDLEFDLVIADEAGQIQAMDLLVPLVRAKKAVLVGDHKQLPPVVDEEIKKRLDVENLAQLEWLEKSLFEQIIQKESVPVTRKVMLDTQYRIPPLVADFISAEFYGNEYKTGHTHTYSDQFFDHPMVFIDTQRADQRFETNVREVDGTPGYTNELEARLIVSLVHAYLKSGAEWGVIVPYKKQAELIRQKLRNQIPDEELEDLVATVDSFQGKERDIIIFGFTRSNRFGRVGFLTESRRLNVSLTRARHQLILVGDATFLAATVEDEFSGFIGRLLSIVRKNNGAYIYADQLGKRLSTR
jgi:hypothetical protein